MATPVIRVPRFDPQNGLQYRESIHGAVQEVVDWRDHQFRQSEGIQGVLAEKAVEIQEMKLLM